MSVSNDNDLLLEELEQTCYFSTLPEPIVHHIFAFLPTVDIVRACSLVSRSWLKMSRANDLWEHILSLKYSIDNLSPTNWRISTLPKFPHLQRKIKQEKERIHNYETFSRLTLSRRIWNRMVFAKYHTILPSPLTSDMLIEGNRFVSAASLNGNGILGVHIDLLDRASGVIRLWNVNNYNIEPSGVVSVPHGLAKIRVLNNVIWSVVGPRFRTNESKIVSCHSFPKQSIQTASRFTRNAGYTLQTSIPISSVDAGNCGLFAGDIRGRVYYWQMNASSICDKVEFSSIESHQKAIECCKLNESMNVLWTSSLDKTSRLWDIRMGSVVTTLEHSGHIESIQCDQNDLFTGSFTGVLSQYDIRNLEQPIFSTQIDQRITSLDYDCHKLMACANQQVLIWDRKDMTNKRVILKLNYRAQTGFCYDEKLIISDESGNVCSWTPRVLPNYLPQCKFTPPPNTQQTSSCFQQ